MISRTRIAALACAVAVVLLPPMPGAHATQGGADARARSVIVLDGVRVHLRAGTEQVVTVNHTRGYRARVTFWRMTENGWTRRFVSANGRIGYGGLVPGKLRTQGTGTTPLGTYRLPWAFGFQDRRDSWRLRYRAVQQGDFWVQDNASRYYNRYRNQAEGGFRWRLPAGDPNSSERLTHFRRQYDLSVVIAYNHHQVRHRGAGIFLHVNGSGATSGCVSAPGWFLQKAMGALDPDLAPVIAVGR